MSDKPKDNTKDAWDSNPELSYEFVKQSIIAQAEREMGQLEKYEFGSNDNFYRDIEDQIT